MVVREPALIVKLMRVFFMRDSKFFQRSSHQFQSLKNRLTCLIVEFSRGIYLRSARCRSLIYSDPFLQRHLLVGECCFLAWLVLLIVTPIGLRISDIIEAQFFGVVLVKPLNVELGRRRVEWRFFVCFFQTGIFCNPLSNLTVLPSRFILIQGGFKAYQSRYGKSPELFSVLKSKIYPKKKTNPLLLK
jgi:hypothetical protein